MIINLHFKNNFFFFRLFLWLVPFFVLIYIIYLQTNPLGLARHYTKIPGKKHKIISDLRPVNRVDEPRKNQNGELVQNLTGKLVYFDLSRSEKNQKITIRAYFKTNLAEANLGILRSKQKEADFEVRPIYNQFLESLKWNFLSRNGLTLYQRHKEFDSLAQFFKAPPINRTRVIYYQNQKNPFRLLDLNNLEGVDFILTRYQRGAITAGGWRRNEQGFEVAKYFLDDHTVRFVFLLPGIENGYFKLHKIEAVVDEPANNFFRKLKRWLIK